MSYERKFSDLARYIPHSIDTAAWAEISSKVIVPASRRELGIFFSQPPHTATVMQRNVEARSFLVRSKILNRLHIWRGRDAAYAERSDAMPAPRLPQCLSWPVSGWQAISTLVVTAGMEYIATLVNAESALMQCQS